MPSVLDSATAPLRIRVKLATECGGTFATTPGDVLIDQQLNPQPTTGHAYQATAKGSGKPTSYGEQTVCAYLEEEGDNRMFANDTADPPPVNVSRACTAQRGPLRRGARGRWRRARAPAARAHTKATGARAEARGEADQDRQRTIAAARGRRAAPGVAL